MTHLVVGQVLVDEIVKSKSEKSKITDIIILSRKNLLDNTTKASLIYLDPFMSSKKPKEARKSQLGTISNQLHFHAAVQVNHGLLSKYSKNIIVNILKIISWLCEQKSALTEQFKRKTLIEKGYDKLLKKFMILNYK